MDNYGTEAMGAVDDRHGLPYLKNYRVAQVSTHGHDRPIVPLLPSWKEFAGTMHRDNVPIPPSGSWDFPMIYGPGKIVNFWCTSMPPMDLDLAKGMIGAGDLIRNFRHLQLVFPFHYFWNLLKNVWIEIYFDGETAPSVNAPMGDFFGVGFGEYKHYTSRYLAMTAGGFVCQFHMPYRKSARVVIHNKNTTLSVPAFYGAVTYLTYPDESLVEKQGYFHAVYREEAPTSRGKPYVILDTQSMGIKDRPGHYVGVVLNTESADKRAGFAYLEGNTKIWVDGETEQSLEYTGIEDYYQSGWYYVKTRNRAVTEFSADYHGLTVKSLNRMGMLGNLLGAGLLKTRVSQYRFHPEGIPFHQNVHITVHHGEFDEIASNFSSVAYWYQAH